MLSIEEETKVRCALDESNRCQCKEALEQIFHCQLLPHCEYGSLLKSCLDGALAMEEDKKYRQEYPDG